MMMIPRPRSYGSTDRHGESRLQRKTQRNVKPKRLKAKGRLLLQKVTQLLEKYTYIIHAAEKYISTVQYKMYKYKKMQL